VSHVKCFADVRDAVLEVAKKSGAHAVIPGYGELLLSATLMTGFLSENAGFCERVEKAGLVWVGPPSRVINQFGLKHTARELAVEAGVPVIKGSNLLSSAEEAVKVAEDIGYPVSFRTAALLTSDHAQSYGRRRWNGLADLSLRVRDCSCLPVCHRPRRESVQQHGHVHGKIRCQE
jgi:hypothetical protein